MRIGSCLPAYPPFTYPDKTGFEVDHWARIYRATRSQIYLHNDPVQLAALGTVPPEIEWYPFEDLLNMVENGTVDVGLCGVYALPERARRFDFGPPYQFSGMRIVIPMAGALTIDDVDLWVVMKGMYGAIDSTAIFALLALLYCTTIFAHMFWIVERADNRNVLRDYGKGVFQGMWFGIVTATTVGYGDVVPVTRLGKVLGLWWIILGTLFAAMFSAAITSSLVTADVGSWVSGVPAVQTLTDLENARMGANFQAAVDSLHQKYPSKTVTLFKSPKASYEALRDELIDAIIEDGSSAQVLVAKVESEFAGMFDLLRDVTFDHRMNCLIVSRPGGGLHPLYRSIVEAQLQVQIEDGGRPFAELIDLWFGAGNSVTDLERKEGSQKVFQQGLARINWAASAIWLALVCGWVVLIVLKDYKEIRNTYITDGLRSALKLGTKFSKAELRKACDALFEELDEDKSGHLDVEEMVDLLEKLGRVIPASQLYHFFGEHAVEAGVGLNDDPDQEEITDEREHSGFMTKFWASPSTKNLTKPSHDTGLTAKQLPKVHISPQTFFELVTHILQGDTVDEETMNDPVTSFQLDGSTNEIQRQMRDMERRIEKMMMNNHQAIIRGGHGANGMSEAAQARQISRSSSDGAPASFTNLKSNLAQYLSPGGLRMQGGAHRTTPEETVDDIEPINNFWGDGDNSREDGGNFRGSGYNFRGGGDDVEILSARSASVLPPRAGPSELPGSPDP